MSKGSSGELKQISTLVDLLTLRATHQASSTAYQFLPDGEVETATLTYGELEQSAQAVATLLQGFDVQGQPILLLYPPGLAYVVAFLGCAYAGAIAVPAYPPRPNRSLERLQVMIQDAGATIALTHSTVLRGLERRFVECPALKALHWLATDTLDLTLAEQWINPSVTADSLALLQYTSGSTGNPKGVKVSHGNLIHNSAAICEFFGHSDDCRGVSWLPPYHDMGLVGGIVQPLYIGVPMVLMPPVAFLQKPLRWLAAIARYRATTSGGPNFAYDLCVQKTTPEQRAQLDLRSWQVAFSGAEPIRAETLDRFTSAFAPSGFQRQAFYPCYGMAETTLIVTGSDRQAAPHILHIDEQALKSHQVMDVPAAGQAVVGCGRSAPDQSLQIINPETCMPCQDGQVGEIWVTVSGSTAQGYWKQPQLTQQVFQAYTATGAGPFLRTGDLGFLRAGELFVTGRRKELIIIRGRNYYPKDIETTVEAVHEALRPGAGAAFAITIEGQERLVVVQEVERSYVRSLPTDEIVQAVRRAVAEQHDLQLYGLQLIKTGGIPKTSSGKIQRFQCRAGYLDHQLDALYTWQLAGAEDPGLDWGDRLTGDPVDASLATRPPAIATHGLSLPQEGYSPTALQTWLTTWLAQELQIPVAEIDVTRPFAEYGLDSVTAVELTEVLQTTIQHPLSPTLAYEYPTIEAVAAHLGTLLGHGSANGEDTAEQVTDQDDLVELLNELENLSEAEVEELLGQQGR